MESPYVDPAAALSLQARRGAVEQVSTDWSTHAAIPTAIWLNRGLVMRDCLWFCSQSRAASCEQSGEAALLRFAIDTHAQYNQFLYTFVLLCALLGWRF